MKNKKLGQWLLRLPVYLYTILFVIFPIVYMFILSFLTKAHTWGFTFNLTLDNYRKVFSSFYMGIFLS